MYLTHTGALTQETTELLIEPFLSRKIPTFAQGGGRFVRKGVLLGMAQSDFNALGLFFAQTLGPVHARGQTWRIEPDIRGHPTHNLEHCNGQTDWVRPASGPAFRPRNNLRPGQTLDDEATGFEHARSHVHKDPLLRTRRHHHGNGLHSLDLGGPFPAIRAYLENAAGASPTACCTWPAWPSRNTPAASSTFRREPYPTAENTSETGGTWPCPWPKA